MLTIMCYFYLEKKKKSSTFFKSQCLMILFQDNSKKLLASDTGMLRTYEGKNIIRETLKKKLFYILILLGTSFEEYLKGLGTLENMVFHIWNSSFSFTQ